MNAGAADFAGDWKDQLSVGPGFQISEREPHSKRQGEPITLLRPGAS